MAEIEKQFTRLEAGVRGLAAVQANLKRYRAAVLKAACEGKLVLTEAELARQRIGRSYEYGPVAQATSNCVGSGLRRQKLSAKRDVQGTGHSQTAGRTRTLPEGWTWCFTDGLYPLWHKRLPRVGTLLL